MATWTKKRFESQPVTETPPGTTSNGCRRAWQVGCPCPGRQRLDVGSRLSEAKEGCRRFFDEAIEDGYSVGALLWTTQVGPRRHQS